MILLQSEMRTYVEIPRRANNPHTTTGIPLILLLLELALLLPISFRVLPNVLTAAAEVVATGILSGHLISLPR